MLNIFAFCLYAVMVSFPFAGKNMIPILFALLYSVYIPVTMSGVQQTLFVAYMFEIEDVDNEIENEKNVEKEKRTHLIEMKAINISPIVNNSLEMKYEVDLN